MREAEMMDRASRNNRWIETVETVLEAHSLRSITSLKRGVNERKLFAVTPAVLPANSDGLADGNVGVTKNLPRVFLRKNPGANCEKPNQPKKIERTPTRPLDHE
jgi:hypothetical protein